MKTIAFQDIKGGSLKGYFKKGQTRFQRIFEALKELEHTGCIRIYLVKGKKLRLIKTKGL